MLAKQVAALNAAFRGAGFHFNLVGVQHVVNASWCVQSLDNTTHEMTRAVKRCANMHSGRSPAAVSRSCATEMVSWSHSALRSLM